MNTKSKDSAVASLEAAFVNQYLEMVGTILNGKSTSFRSIRSKAIADFSSNGLPVKKSEAWKYTNITDRVQASFANVVHDQPETVSQDFILQTLIPGLDGPFVVIENGKLNRAASSLTDLPKGVIVASLAEGAEEHPGIFEKHFNTYANDDEGLVNLNTAFANHGLFVHVPRGLVVESVLQIVRVTTSDEFRFIQPRSLVVVEEAASLNIVEHCCSTSSIAVFSNRVVETYTGTSARLSIIRIQDEPESTQVTNLYSVQKKDSVVFDLTLSLDGEMIRNNLTFTHLDPHCETHLNGFFVGRGDRHIDNHTLVDHATTDSYSNETFKGVLYDTSTGVFNGKVLVRRDAQRTNAYQSNKSILMSDTAHMYTKPELEIYADDVKCSHGATTGRLEPESLFYLQSRGISEHRARVLLLGAFAQEVVESVSNPIVRDYLADVLNRRVS